MVRRASLAHHGFLRRTTPCELIQPENVKHFRGGMNQQGVTTEIPPRHGGVGNPVVRVPQRFRFLLVLCLIPALNSCQKNQLRDRVCFHKSCVDVEIVDNEAQRQRGLQNRSFLPENAGMLFIFPESRPHSFWMKETLIPLDMIWMDESRRIVHIQQNAPPCFQDLCLSYTPLASAMYVLEVNAGQAEQLGLKVGERVEFRLEKYLKK